MDNMFKKKIREKDPVFEKKGRGKVYLVDRKKGNPYFFYQ